MGQHPLDPNDIVLAGPSTGRQVGEVVVVFCQQQEGDTASGGTWLGDGRKDCIEALIQLRTLPFTTAPLFKIPALLLLRWFWGFSIILLEVGGRVMTVRLVPKARRRHFLCQTIDYFLLPASVHDTHCHHHYKPSLFFCPISH